MPVAQRRAPINHQDHAEIVDTPIVIYGSDADDFFDFGGAAPGEWQYLDIHGGKGNDVIYGSAYRDEIRGDEGNDSIFGGNGGDILAGGLGADGIFGEGGDDLIYGDYAPGEPHIWDQPGGADYYLGGGAGNDRIFGGWGDDNIYGDQGNDVLEGQDGRDTIFGGSGDDIIKGGSFADTLTGGMGADRFVISADDFFVDLYMDWKDWIPPFSLSFSYGYETDTIKDFNAAQGDRIDISSVLRRATSFTDPGATAADALDQGYLYFVQHGMPGQPGFGTTVMVDHDGGAHSDGRQTALVDLLGVSVPDLVSLPFIV